MLIPHLPTVILHSDIFDCNGPEFIAIGRKMVSNPVSNSLRVDTPARDGVIYGVIFSCNNCKISVLGKLICGDECALYTAILNACSYIRWSQMVIS